MSRDAAGAPPPAPFEFKLYWQVLGLIAFFALAPWVIVYVAAVIADLNGCTLSATEPLPCMIFGADRGETLFGLAGFADFAYISLSVGLMLVLIWGAILTVSWMAWRRKAKGVADFTKVEVNFSWYGVALLAIFAVTAMILAGWLPFPVIFLVIFVLIFWVFSFLMALSVTIRDKVRKP
jgi:hypothetical protein